MPCEDSGLRVGLKPGVNASPAIGKTRLRATAFVPQSRDYGVSRSYSERVRERRPLQGRPSNIAISMHHKRFMMRIG